MGNLSILNLLSSLLPPFVAFLDLGDVCLRNTSGSLTFEEGSVSVDASRADDGSRRRELARGA